MAHGEKERERRYQEVTYEKRKKRSLSVNIIRKKRKKREIYVLSTREREREKYGEKETKETFKFFFRESPVPFCCL